MTTEEIAQWVIDNRYPKPGKERMTDTEMYHLLKSKIEAVTLALKDTIIEEEVKITVDDKGIRIIIPKGILLKAFHGNHLQCKVTASDLFIKEVAQELQESHQETGLTPVHEMFDNIFEKISESGTTSIEIKNEDEIF